ncbi:MAG: phenol hydroxylase [Rhodocyclaceae bacterium]|nr:phenol hydroxylase [Rhodocyclaceae bacterium]
MTPQPAAPSAAREAPFDPAKRFVRVREVRPDGFIEFDFAIGEPEIFVEMMLRAEAFDDFCEAQRAVFMTGRASLAGNDTEWRLSQTSGRQFK